ncbi:MAG: DMT family transporter [Methanobacteriota archaeon]
MKTEVATLGLVIIIFWGIWGFLYKLGISKIGLGRALLWSSMTYGLTNLIIISFLLHRGISLSGSGSWLIVAGSIFATAGSLLFLFALQKYPVSIVLPLTALYPAVSVVLGILILREELKPLSAVGILLAIVAGYLLSK